MFDKIDTARRRLQGLQSHLWIVEDTLRNADSPIFTEAAISGMESDLEKFIAFSSEFLSMANPFSPEYQSLLASSRQPQPETVSEGEIS